MATQTTIARAAGAGRMIRKPFIESDRVEETTIYDYCWEKKVLEHEKRIPVGPLWEVPRKKPRGALLS